VCQTRGVISLTTFGNGPLNIEGRDLVLWALALMTHCMAHKVGGRAKDIRCTG